MEFKSNSSALKNSEFVEESIKEMHRADTVKECLTKPKVLNPLSVSTKGKNSLVLDLRYLKNLFFIDKIRFNDWNIFQNYLQDNKGYLFKFDLKNGYGHVSIFDEHQTHLASAGKLISKRIILSLLSYLLD